MSNTSTKSSVSSTSSILPRSTIALIEKTKRKSKSKQSKREEANKKIDLPPSTLIDAAKTDGQVTFEDLGIEKRLFGSALEELGEFTFLFCFLFFFSFLFDFCNFLVTQISFCFYEPQRLDETD